MYAHIRTHTQACTQKQIYMHVDTLTHTHTQLICYYRKYLHNSSYDILTICVYTCKCVCVYIHVNVCVCIHVSVCVCIYM